jgi:hypothetical protein
MNHSNFRPNPEPSASKIRPICVPRPAQQQAFPPVPKQSAAPPKLASKTLEPPPSPRRPRSQPAKASPPPLPKPVLLADADLIDDEDTTQVARATQPSSDVEFDVELDCFSRSEPPPESRPQRKRTLFALVTGLVLASACGLFFLGRSAPRATPPTATVAALSAPEARPLLQAPQTRQARQTRQTRPAGPESVPSAAPSARPRPRLSVHEKRAKTALVSGKKPTEPVRSQRLLHNAT